jgi:histidine decarboxylase
MPLTLEQIVNGALGPFDAYCDGYGNPGASGLGYISVLKLETGNVAMETDNVLEGIVSYDSAESTGTYVGQINMIAASSFSGLNGAVWGYHLATADCISDGSLESLSLHRRSDGRAIPVYPVEPLLDACKRLFGTREKRRFPLLPGAHVACAVKSTTARGPASVWCAIALAIAEDPGENADLFIEDCGVSREPEDEVTRTEGLNRLIENIALSIIRCGDNSNVKYKEIFVGYKTEWIPEGSAGCALTCAPYIVLARNAVPARARAERLLSMSLTEWERAVGLAEREPCNS